jgi:hypothetical protein
MPTDKEQNAISSVICTISAATVNDKTNSLMIEMTEPTAKRRPDKNAGIQNDFPTSRYLMFFKVFQLNTHNRAAIEAKAMFETVINQFIANRQISFIKIQYIDPEFKSYRTHVQHKYS